MKIVIKDITLPQVAMIDMLRSNKKYELPENTGQRVDINLLIATDTAEEVLNLMSTQEFIGMTIKDMSTPKGSVAKAIDEKRVKPIRLNAEGSAHPNRIRSGLDFGDSS